MEGARGAGEDGKMGIGIVSAYLFVELTSSHNEYIRYPAKGLLQITEIGRGGQIICAVFRELKADGSLAATVVVKDAAFNYTPNDPASRDVALQLHKENYPD